MKQSGFSLTELLIALAILGTISTFAIPKVLQMQADASDISRTKEVISMVSGAMLVHKHQNGINNQTWFYDFTPYMNYVKLDTSGTSIDDAPGYPVASCLSYRPCYKLASGAILRHDEDRIGGTTPSHALYFMVDPDGKPNSTNKSVYFLVYANGKVRSWGTMENPTVTSSNSYTPNASLDPPWFKW